MSKLQSVFPLTQEESEAIQALDDTFRLGITPYYLSLMDPNDLNCPIRRQAIPLLAEQQWSPQEVSDPLAEERDMPVIGVTHRYPNRALLYMHIHVQYIADIVHVDEKLVMLPVIKSI